MSLVARMALTLVAGWFSVSAANAVPIAISEAQAGGSTRIGGITNELFSTDPVSVAQGFIQRGFFDIAAAGGNADLVSGTVGASASISGIGGSSSGNSVSALGVGLLAAEFVAGGLASGSSTQIDASVLVDGVFRSTGFNSTAGGIMITGVSLFGGALPTDIDPFDLADPLTPNPGVAVSTGVALFAPSAGVLGSTTPGILDLGFSSSFVVDRGTNCISGPGSDCDKFFSARSDVELDVIVGEIFTILFFIATQASDTSASGVDLSVDFENTSALELTPIDPRVTLRLLPATSTASEPATALLFALALIGTGLTRSRRKR